eukprot:9263021-Alexandrium_andersonii.AAC.1
MPVSAATRLNPQSAMRTTQNHFRCSNLELRGPRNVLKIGPRSSRRVRPAPYSAQISNPATKWVMEGVPSNGFASSRTP